MGSKKLSALVALLIVLAAAAALMISAGTAAAGSGTSVSYTAPDPADGGTTNYKCWVSRTTIDATHFMENEKCVLTGDTAGYADGTYTGDPKGSIPPFGDGFRWQSDFDGTSVADSWTIKVTGGGDCPFVMSIVAYYTNAPAVTPVTRNPDMTFLCYSQWQTQPDAFLTSMAGDLLASGQYWLPVAETAYPTGEAIMGNDGTLDYLACQGTMNGEPPLVASTTTTIGDGGDVINNPSLVNTLDRWALASAGGK